MKFGPFSPTFQHRQRILNLFYSSETTEIFHLFIICFYFLFRQSNEHEMQCRDIRLTKSLTSTSGDFLPTYNPLFVPLMYALIVLMLLPMIIQHHRQKRALLFQRRNEIRRLSISIVKETSETIRPTFTKALLSQIIEDESNGNNELDLLDVSTSDRTIFADLPVTFTLDNLQPFIRRSDESEHDEESTITADECIAHLLNTTPWRNSSTDRFPLTSSLETTNLRDFPTAMEDFHHSQSIRSMSDWDSNEKHPKIKLHPVVCETDV